jgi:hypothetical protein
VAEAIAIRTAKQAIKNNELEIWIMPKELINIANRA